MSYSAILKEIARGVHGARNLNVDEAARLYGAMLDGGVPEMELGAILIALRMKGESEDELLGFYQALESRVYTLDTPAAGVRPIVIPTYNGARHQANLVPLLALLLVKFGIPVLIHGTLESQGRTTTAYILRELGILPSGSLAQANTALANDNIAFVPTAVLSPGLANLLALRNRLGVRNSAHSLAKMMSPFSVDSLRLVSVSHPDYLIKMQAFFETTGLRALLLRGTEGEAFANPKRRPDLLYCDDGQSKLLFEAEAGPLKIVPHLPNAIDAVTTAAWIQDAMAGRQPIPLAIINQLACCLYGTGYTSDMNQAKAIVAMETNSLTMA
ncbi:DNA-binding protein YbiB [Sulfuriferula nivalis]|uniref:DNA-binding protein YbiB n=1 Tax=Sulfuriferula nivalis TaxID=2675298 RepID=A0A809RZE3_9PROT|nr:DNA-binding protein YbiB [Sulfuriferula nivalis]BBO99587.1 DNA-binding protein YbiB [Sulfuriferula nivalis]